MTRISKPETKRLLNHALATSQKLTAKKLAEELGEPASRVSEGRQAGWTLTEQQAHMLIRKYGLPRSEPGQYVRAEEAESIQAFLGNEQILSRKRHLEQVIHTVCSPSSLTKLADYLRPNDDTYPQPEVLNRFETFVKSEPFLHWLDRAEAYVGDNLAAGAPLVTVYANLSATIVHDLGEIDRLPKAGEQVHLPYTNSLASIGLKNGLNLDGPRAMDLLLLGQLYQLLSSPVKNQDLGLNQPFSLTNQSNRYTAIHEKEFIITGNLVWEEEVIFKDPKIGQPFLHAIMYPTAPTDPKKQHRILAFANAPYDAPPLPKNSWDLDRWTSASIKLFINKHCDYNMVIEMGNTDNLHAPVRSVVIPKISGLELFTHLKDLTKWLELGEIPDATIKNDIAMLGGYIPGTTVL